MKKILNLFHLLSYLQYLFFAIALFFGIKPMFWKTGSPLEDINKELLFIGIAVSFSSFYDIKKRNRLMNKIFSSKKYTRIYLIYATTLTISLFLLGFYSLFFSENSALNELSVGIIALGLGSLSLLKMSIEIVKMYSEED